MANTKSMVKRKLCDPDPEHIAAKEDFRKIAMEIYKSLIERQIFFYQSFRTRDGSGEGSKKKNTWNYKFKNLLAISPNWLEIIQW